MHEENKEAPQTPKKKHAVDSKGVVYAVEDEYDSDEDAINLIAHQREKEAKAVAEM